MNEKRVDLYILTGFLGSGKSSLLSNLIRYEKEQGRRIGVLMNELGEVSIDSAFVPENTPLKELLNGCICCTIQGELSLKLYEMLNEYELDAIYIEATGAAHPMEVLDACTHPSLADRTEVRAIVTVVDAKQWQERSNTKNSVKKLLEEQVKYADVLVLNKIDTLPADNLEFVCQDIQGVNSSALLLPVRHAAVDPSLLISTQHKGTAHDDHTKSHVHHHLHLRTFTQELKEPLNRIAFEKWLKSVPGRVFRGKGFVHLTESPGIFLFQYAYGEPMFTRYQIDRPYQPILVLIGEDLDHERMTEELLQLQKASHSSR
jgi:G3E family GTPase